MIYCEPIFRESFIIDTHASTKHTGIHRGLLRLKKALKDSQYVYALQIKV